MRLLLLLLLSLACYAQVMTDIGVRRSAWFEGTVDMSRAVMQFPRTTLNPSGGCSGSQIIFSLQSSTIWVCNSNSGTWTESSGGPGGGTVASVNGQTGAVVLNAGHIDGVAPLAGNNTWTGQNDFSGATLTIPARTVTSLPGTCSNGDMARLSSTGVPYYCQSNTWTAMGGASTEVHNLPTAGYNGSSTVPASGWSYLSGGGITVNNYGEHASFDFADAATGSAYNKLIVPDFAPTSMQVKATFLWGSGGTGGQVVRFAVSTACLAAAGADMPWSGGAATYGTATNIDATVATATSGFAMVATGNVSFTCAAGNVLAFRFQRLGSDAADTFTAAIRLLNVRVKF